MLPVTIDGHQHVVSLFNSIVKRAFESGSVALVDLMRDDLQVGLCGEQFRSSVTRTVIHNQDLVGIAPDFIKNAENMLLFVKDRQRGENTA